MTDVDHGAPGTGGVVRITLRLTIVLAVALALILVEFTSRSGVLWRLITFTYQANLLAAAFYAWALMSPKSAAGSGFRGAVVLYVAVAGVVWNLFLTDHSAGYTPSNILLHVVVPVLAVTDWLTVGHGAAVRWWHPIAWVAYPAVYGAVALIVLNTAGRRAPYYFLDPTSVGGLTVLLNSLLLIGGFLGLGYLLLALARGRSANA